MFHGLPLVSDFGLSINMNDERPVTRAGTLDYMAPEVLICPDKKLPEENKNNLSLVYSKQVSLHLCLMLTAQFLLCTVANVAACSEVDIWAIGILTFELIVGFPPFEKVIRFQEWDFEMCVSRSADNACGIRKLEQKHTMKS